MERIQKYALRIIYGKPPRTLRIIYGKLPRTSSEPLQKILGCKTLEKRRYKALVHLVHRCLSDEAPPFLYSNFRPNTALGYIRTRWANKLHLPRLKVKYFQSTSHSKEHYSTTSYQKSYEHSKQSEVSK